MNFPNEQNRKYFTDNTSEYLEKSFQKVGLDKVYFEKLLEWLSKSPKWNTLRVNKNLANNSKDSVNDIQNFLDKSFDNLNNKLLKEGVYFPIPKCKVLSNFLDECIVYEYSKSKSMQDNIKFKSDIKCIIDVKCAQAVFRGADIFIPGIISLSLSAKSQDLICIYADLEGKCLKGSDANLYFKKSVDSLQFIGTGWLLYDRDQIFKNSEQKLGIGIRLKELVDGSYTPPFHYLNQTKYFPQNLPSIICARVLDPKPGQLILDMCAAPGGKTTHLAEIIGNKGQIIAFDKISSKILKMNELCKKLNTKCVECFVTDATKIDYSVYMAESFDRILVDAPCSALGQRPLIFNNIDVNQLKSYVNYQRMILENAVKLLKPGGFMVYSTCTITLEENEEQVSWLLSKHKKLKLVDQTPFNFAASSGFQCEGLDESQSRLLQRFCPSFKSEDDLNDIYYDTNGFFISKFLKEY
ncbi:unnamed protein product [Brachionus calyciflorus]|uniref:SAM-dependent MTase RsmB/NOP-type domain-containing protein n=1 Tax=Brachionus calyciflorus TaxID=104777 RepID=A0A814AFN6_9BILA|nr:unnamed protein product [Brachionus calyciflorus]